jgi:uncharacterized membrane protein YebE (DUF533 family)
VHWTKPVAGVAALLTAVGAVGALVAFLLAGPGPASLAAAVLVVALVAGWTVLGGPGGDTPYW